MHYKALLKTDREEKGEMNLNNVRPTKKRRRRNSVCLDEKEPKKEKKISQVQLSWRENH